MVGAAEFTNHWLPPANIHLVAKISVTRLGDLLGNFLKPLATLNLPQSPPFVGNFWIGVKIICFSS